VTARTAKSRKFREALLHSQLGTGGHAMRMTSLSMFSEPFFKDESSKDILEPHRGV
jgi:hypothetical protein